MNNLSLGFNVALSMTQSFKVSFHLPRYVVAYFVPRPAELLQVTTFLAPDQASERRKIYVLHGLGGAGKTQLMLEFARSYKMDYTSIFWLNGATEDLLRQSLLQVASRITSGPILEALEKYTTVQNKSLQPQEVVPGPSASTPAAVPGLLLQAVISAVFD